MSFDSLFIENEKSYDTFYTITNKDLIGLLFCTNVLNSQQYIRKVDLKMQYKMEKRKLWLIFKNVILVYVFNTLELQCLPLQILEVLFTISSVEVAFDKWMQCWWFI